MENTPQNVFFINPIEVKVKEELPRYRKNLVNLEELRDSIKEHGQIQPILLSRDMELIAGGRRLAACILGQMQVMAIFRDEVDDITMRELEIEENLQRADLTPAEAALAVADLHELKQKKYGVAISGKEGSGWRLEDTAKIIGKTAGSVIDDLAIASALKEFPSLNICKTKSDIKKAAKSLTNTIERLVNLKNFEEKIAESGIVTHLENADSREHMKSIPDGSINLLLTDPPFGIEIDKIAIQMGGITGGEHTTSGYKFDDSKENAIDLLATLALESFRFCTFNAHAFVFVAPEHFSLVRELFMAVGWNVHIKPLVWVKRETGQNNAPHAWPSSAYEFILFARKSESVLVLQGKPDWIQCDPVNPSVKIHTNEKPVKLLEELISRTSDTGDTLYDPFMGSGSAIEAGINMDMITYGCDILEDSYAATCSRIATAIQRKEDIKKRAMEFTPNLEEPFTVPFYDPETSKFELSEEM